jgi:hypothetical protein
LNVHRVSDVRQIEVHTAEPFVSDPSLFEVEIAITNLKKVLWRIDLFLGGTLETNEYSHCYAIGE